MNSRVDDLNAVLSGGREEREVPEEIIEMIYGGIWYRMATNQPFTPAAARRVAAAAVIALTA